MNEPPDDDDNENDESDNCDEVRKEASARLFNDRRDLVSHKC